MFVSFVIQIDNLSHLIWANHPLNCHSVFVTCFCREAGHHDLADRLVEIQYELTDRLAFYLCGRKPGMKQETPAAKITVFKKKCIR